MSTAANPTGGGCAGTSCVECDPCPLHHVRHRGGALSRLCTSCVLTSHAGSFCAVCFDLFDQIPSASGLVRCRTCALSISHRTCLAGPDLAANFVCPSCRSSKEGFSYSYFPRESRLDGKRRTVDLQSAKILSAAARIAANSMAKAALVIRADADRKVREAVVAKKRAKEMLEKVLDDSRALAPAGVVDEPKRKVGKTRTREIEKWMRLHEPIPLAVVQEERGSFVDGKDRIVNGRKEERKRSVSDSLSGPSAKEEEKYIVGDGEKGPRLPQSNQDTMVSRTNPRSGTVFTGSAGRTTLHS